MLFLPPLATDKMIRMTLLVGMVGADGVVLASDRNSGNATDSECWNGQSTDGVEALTLITKIRILKQHYIAYACAGDRLATDIGYEMEVLLDAGGTAFPFDGMDESLRRAIANASSRRPRDRSRRRQLIVAVGGSQVPQPSLWRLEVEDVPTGDGEQVTAIPYAYQHSGIVFGGACTNPATFLGTYYFKPDSRVHALKFLAAHVILTAGEVDNRIRGLDVVVCDKDGVHEIGTQEKEELASKSKNLHKGIRRNIFFF